jgi:DnaD/phage-associated family protein
MVGDLSSLTKALEELTELCAILKADLEWMNETYYFINSPQGRAAVKAIESGEWQGANKEQTPVQLTPERPNIYQLYEENIGLITPMMADILKEDEADYPADWIEEAIRQAVAHNARNWKYVQAILKRRRTEGHGNEQNRRDNSQSPEDYRKGWLGHD